MARYSSSDPRHDPKTKHNHRGGTARWDAYGNRVPGEFDQYGRPMQARGMAQPIDIFSTPKLWDLPNAIPGHPGASHQQPQGDGPTDEEAMNEQEREFTSRGFNRDGSIPQNPDDVKISQKKPAPSNSQPDSRSGGSPAEAAFGYRLRPGVSRFNAIDAMDQRVPGFSQMTPQERNLALRANPSRGRGEWADGGTITRYGGGVESGDGGATRIYDHRKDLNRMAQISANEFVIPAKYRTPGAEITAKRGYQGGEKIVGEVPKPAAPAPQRAAPKPLSPEAASAASRFASSAVAAPQRPGPTMASAAALPKLASAPPDNQPSASIAAKGLGPAPQNAAAAPAKPAAPTAPVASAPASAPTAQPSSNPRIPFPVFRGSGFDGSKLDNDLQAIGRAINRPLSDKPITAPVMPASNFMPGKQIAGDALPKPFFKSTAEAFVNATKGSGFDGTDASKKLRKYAEMDEPAKAPFKVAQNGL